MNRLRAARYMLAWAEVADGGVSTRLIREHYKVLRFWLLALFWTCWLFLALLRLCRMWLSWNLRMVRLLFVLPRRFALLAVRASRWRVSERVETV